MNEYMGKTCPYCKTAIQTGEEVKICKVCLMPHHTSCWEENKGCTTFGCAEQQYEARVDSVQSQNNPTPITKPSRRVSVFAYLRSVRQSAKTDIMVAIPFWFFLIGIFLVVVGVFYPIPNREFSFYGITEYVGGDAYNATIEASIRAGEIAGAQTAKTLYICGGLILAAISIFNIQSTQLTKKPD